MNDSPAYTLEYVTTRGGRLVAYIMMDGERVAVIKKPALSYEYARQLADAYIARLRANEAQVAREWEQG